MPTFNPHTDPSLRPYLIRALVQWCEDQGYTPHLSVKVDAGTQVPMEYVRGGEITLNIGSLATHRLELDNDYIRFQARFGGAARQIIVPIGNVQAVFARESQAGMGFAPLDEAELTAYMKAQASGSSAGMTGGITSGVEGSAAKQAGQSATATTDAEASKNLGEAGKTASSPANIALKPTPSHLRIVK